MPQETMSDECDVQIDNQFAQNNCYHDVEKDKQTAKEASVLEDCTITNATCDVAHSDGMNSDNIHLEWKEEDHINSNSKQSTNGFNNNDDPILDQPTNETVNENNIPSNQEEDFDDFCDFEGCKFEGFKDCNSTNEIVEFANFASSECENFANFDDSNWSSAVDNKVANAPDTTTNTAYEEADGDDGFDDFADFKSASNDRPSNESLESNPTTSSPPQRTASIDLNQLFRDTFPAGSMQMLNYHSNEPIGSLFDNCPSQSQAMWASLQEMDLKTICQLHKWKDSCSFKRLLQALKVDANMIHMQSDIYPAYSSHLGPILEPVSVSNWAQPGQENSANRNHTSGNSVSRAKVAANESPVLPSDNEFPSVFSLNQDLDFFESKYTYKSNAPNTKDDFISEFESIILENTESVQQPQQESREAEATTTISSRRQQHLHQQAQTSSSSASPISSVNDLQKMLQSTIAKTNNEQVLSAEALQILNELPNLSFIRAKVLMFPINEQSS